MKLSKLMNLRVLTFVVASLIISVTVYGFAAANVVPESGAGDGNGVVSGYTVSNIDYTLLASDPTKVESLTLDITPTTGAGAPADVLITVDAGTTWITCSGPVTETWTCAFTVASEPLVSAIDSLQVVAAE